MSDGFNFEKLEIYKEAISFTTGIYEVTTNFPKSEIFGLTSQLKRAAVSIVSNICEGSSRGKTEFKRFLDFSRGSVFECAGQLRIALQLKYLKEEIYKMLYQESIKLSKMLMALKKSL